MTKAESEKAIRHLCHVWAKTLSPQDLTHPSFASFKSWMEANGRGSYFKFRSLVGADEDAERWFDNEFKQSWRR